MNKWIGSIETVILLVRNDYKRPVPKIGVGNNKLTMIGAHS